MSLRSVGHNRRWSSSDAERAYVSVCVRLLLALLTYKQTCANNSDLSRSAILALMDRFAHFYLLCLEVAPPGRTISVGVTAWPFLQSRSGHPLRKVGYSGHTQAQYVDASSQSCEGLPLFGSGSSIASTTCQLLLQVWAHGPSHSASKACVRYLWS
jgi:hypothetical protein